VVFDYFSYLYIFTYNSSVFMILYVKMSLFDNLSDTSSCDINFEIWEDADDSDDSPDEVCPSDHETGPPSKTSQSTTPSLGPEKRTNNRGNSIGTRISALTRFDEGIPPDFDVILAKTSITKLSCYKLRSKAISRGWVPGTVVEPEHVGDAPRTGRPKTSIATALFIIETMIKNSITRG
jgi:hypothetical protein